MPLSEYEQRVLDQLERDLDADPKLKKTLAKPRRSGSRLALAVAAVIGGLVVLVVGAVSQQPVIGIVGFALMLAVVVWALFAPRRGPAKAGSKAAASGKKSGGRDSRSFMQRLEDRFDRRREGGEF